MAMNPASIGNPFSPVVTGVQLRQIILHQGTAVLWRSKTSAVKCTTGWKANQHDPDCSTCSNKEGYNYVDKKRKVFMLQRDAHAQYNVENLDTVIGANERADYEMYTEFHIGRVMLKDDKIIYDRRYNMGTLELTIMTKKEIFGTVGKKMGWKFLLFKSPKNDSIDAPDFREA